MALCGNRDRGRAGILRLVGLALLLKRIVIRSAREPMLVDDRLTPEVTRRTMRAALA
jgi:hypothetical protein